MAPLFEPGGLVQVQDGPRSQDGAGGSSGSGSIGSWYDLEKSSIGSGRFSEVLRALHRSTGAPRAVKVIKKRELPSAEIRQDGSGLGCRELDILRRMDHPNVIRLYEAFEDENSVFLVLELCEGGDLLERVNGTKDRLPITEVAAIFLQTLCAVDHLWSHGVAHRDLKPEHFVFSRREPERGPLPPTVAAMKLIDFGLSRRIDLADCDRSPRDGVRYSPRIGTVEFMSPETVKGVVQGQHLHKVDMWSLGVLLHIMLTGRYLSPRLADMTTAEYFAKPCWRGIDPDCLDLLGMLLQQEPANRPTAAVAMRHPFMQKALGIASPVLVQRLPIAARAFACTSQMRRLALYVAAREADDCDVAEVRRLYQQLQVACSGSLTKSALRNIIGDGEGGDGGVGGRPLKAVAAALVKTFGNVDSDGSGTIDWTELVAVTLGVADTLVSTVDRVENGAATRAQPNEAAAAKGSDVDTTQPPPPLPPLREDVCWRAFDLLSQGAGAVTSGELGRLLNKSKAKGHRRSGSKPLTDAGSSSITREKSFILQLFCAPSGIVENMCGGERCRRDPGGDSRLSAAAEAAGLPATMDLVDLDYPDRILCEASPDGVLDGKAFLRMIQTPVYTSEKNGGRLVFI